MVIMKRVTVLKATLRGAQGDFLRRCHAELVEVILSLPAAGVRFKTVIPAKESVRELE